MRILCAYYEQATAKRIGTPEEVEACEIKVDDCKLLLSEMGVAKAERLMREAGVKTCQALQKSELL